MFLATARPQRAWPYCSLGTLVPASATAHGTAAVSGASIRAQLIRSAAAPVGGPVTQKELPGCSNPSEPFAGPSQGCASPLYEGGGGVEPVVRRRRRRLGLLGPAPNDLSSTAFVSASPNRQRPSRGPRQTTSLDRIAINPETGGWSSTLCRVPRVSASSRQRAGAERTYNSALASTAGVMGYGWSFPYAMSVHIVRGTATVTQENGSQVVFKRGADKRFHAAPRVIASFKQSSARHVHPDARVVPQHVPVVPAPVLRGIHVQQGASQQGLGTSGLQEHGSVRQRGRETSPVTAAGRPTSATADSGDSPHVRLHVRAHHEHHRPRRGLRALHVRLAGQPQQRHRPERQHDALQLRRVRTG